jgi:hypothetical protein
MEWTFHFGPPRGCLAPSSFDDRALVTVTHSDDLGRPYLIRTTPDVGTRPAWNDANPESVGTVVKRLHFPACRTIASPMSCNPDPNRYEAVSNPYRAGQTSNEGWSVSRIDSLGRVVNVTTYSANGPGALPPPWDNIDDTPVTGVTEYTYDGVSTR